MQRDSVRMFAYAVDFNEIKVYLSKNYYNGVSSKFYLKDIEKNTLTLLQGDASDEENGFKTYHLHTSFQLGKNYQIVDAYGLVCFLDFSPVSMTPEFDKRFYYDGDDLGSIYTRDATTFKVWSPLSTSVILKVFKGKDIALYPMKRGDKGVYEVKVKRDLDKYEYVYMIGMNGNYIESVDPYAYASTANQRSSVVINLDKLKSEKVVLPIMRHKTDAIIYEVGVRDFSMNPYGELRHKGKFLAFTEKHNKTDLGHASGVDYLKELGITHVQMMPVNDFATVDEDQPYELYNWGYDPAQYNVTEGSYVSDPNDGYRRITECQEMITHLHKNGIRVILDVVYNHMHDVNQNALEKTVPYYFFRRNDAGFLSNGSWCGNDLNTTARMCRKYILEICRRWQVIYGCDGFRMDLMGIVDIDTVNSIEKQGRAIDPSFMLYGEGWNMGTALPEEEKAIIPNHYKMPLVGFFNDHFRDTIRGSDQMEIKGYTSGDTYKTNEAIIAMCDYSKFTSLEQSINYVECHDNATVFDKYQVSNLDESQDIRERRCTLALAMTLLAQGVPFIHAGQEFYDTKNGHGNTYNAGDSLNALDWGRKDQFLDNVELISFLTHLRKDNKAFRYFNYDDMHEHVQINNIYHRMIEYHLTQNEGRYKEFKIYFNPSYDNIDVDIEQDFEVLYRMNDEKIQGNRMNVKGVSLVVCAR